MEFSVWFERYIYQYCVSYVFKLSAKLGKFLWLIRRHIFWKVVRDQVWAKWELLKRESHENIVIIYENYQVLSVFSLEPLLGGTSTIERGLRCLQMWRINAVQRSATISTWAHKHCTRFRGLAVLGWRPKYLAGGKNRCPRCGTPQPLPSSSFRHSSSVIYSIFNQCKKSYLLDPSSYFYRPFIYWISDLLCVSHVQGMSYLFQ